MQREAEMRAAIVDREDPPGLMDDQQRAARAGDHDHALGRDVRQGAHADEVSRLRRRHSIHRITSGGLLFAISPRSYSCEISWLVWSFIAAAAARLMTAQARMKAATA